MKLAASLALSLVCLVAACSGATSAARDDDGGDGGADDGGMGARDPSATVLGAEPQRAGDPAKGLHALSTGGYIGCGIPWSAYSQALAFGGATPESEKIPGREGHNALLPYSLTAFVAKSGVEVVSQNCFSCHAGTINGTLVLGLGGADADFTQDNSAQAKQLFPFVTDPTEKAEFTKWLARMATIAPYAKTSTIGANPADAFTGVLFAHHDPKTLAWSDAPLFALPEPEVIPVDVPPWWRMRKKNAMFYIGSGRGDHARIMMTASTLCVDSADDAREIDAYFPDVRAYITSLAAPPFPFGVDSARAASGKAIFESTCARCHGTYGAGESYPNLLVDLAEIQTDATLAARQGQFQGGAPAAWFNGSFYGEKSRLEPHAGYVAPPLDGIWATAPFLHNGSVPTLAALLDSKKRPAYWARTFDSKDYDPIAVGWKFTEPGHGQAAEPDATARKHIYDTSLPGAGNGGHLFGDALSDDDRGSLIEYLKTL